MKFLGNKSVYTRLSYYLRRVLFLYDGDKEDAV